MTSFTKHSRPAGLRQGLGALVLALGGLAAASPALAGPPAPAPAAAPLSSEQLIEALQPNQANEAPEQAGEAPEQAGAPPEFDEPEGPVRSRGFRLISKDKSTATAVATGRAASQRPAAAAAAAPSISMLIQFAFDSSNLQPEGTAALEQLADAMRSPKLARYRFRIEGHTDASGTAAYNLQLSQARADEVRRFLVRRGVPAQRLEPVGRGATEPANTADPMGPENRRVRIVNLGDS